MVRFLITILTDGLCVSLARTQGADRPAGVARKKTAPKPGDVSAFAQGIDRLVVYELKRLDQASRPEIDD